MKEAEGKREKCKTAPGDKDWLILEWFTRNKYVNINNTILDLFTGRLILSLIVGSEVLDSTFGYHVVRDW
jgi:hypothetical protein